MTEQSDPFSTTDCAALLQSVLECLDKASSTTQRVGGDAIALAATHVQQAIELIQSIK